MLEKVEIHDSEYVVSEYYVDRKLKEVRQVDNPHNHMSLDDLSGYDLDAWFLIVHNM